MIDVYVNHLPGTDPFWLRQCFDSVRADPAAAVYDAGCVPGDLNGTRQAALEHGDNEYYCFVDGDDLIEPGAVHLCERYLAEHPECQFVRTREVMIDEIGRERQTPHPPAVLSLEALCAHPAAAHHLVVTRKSFIEEARPLLDRHRLHWDWIVAAFAFKRGNGVLLPWVGYRWRQHGRQWSRSVEAAQAIGAIAADLREALL